MIKVDAEVKEARGRNYQSAREAVGLTRADAARALGISASTLRSWEAGRTEPKLLGLIDMMHLYGVRSADDLLAGA